MTETAQSSDMSTGLSLVFGFLAVLFALVMVLSSYLNAVEHDVTMQLVSGVGLSGTIVAGGIVIAAIHLCK